MKSSDKIKKEKNQVIASLFPSLKFKKIKMDVDASGVHILISANFLKRDNYRIIVQNGRFFLKIKQLKNTFDFKSSLSKFEANQKYFHFDILIPYSQYQYINSVFFQNNTLRIHLTKKSSIRNTVSLSEAS